MKHGILCKKIEDRGFVFDYSNKILKKLIYNKIINKEKEEMHKKAAIILEQDYFDSCEEIIFHLEKSKNNKKVVKYCLENANRMKKS